MLRDYVNKKMIELCEEMLSGEIKIQPTKNGNRTYCEYCDFSAVCQFDTTIKDNKYQRNHLPKSTSGFCFRSRSARRV